MSNEARYQAALDTLAEVRQKIHALHFRATFATAEDEDATLEDTKIVVSYTNKAMTDLDNLSKFLSNRRSKARKRA